IALHSALVDLVSKADSHASAKRLGMLRKGSVDLGAHDKVAALMDFCLHDVRHDGLNRIQQYLAESPPPIMSDEFLLLKAMSEAWFSVSAVKKSEPGIGVRILDVLYDGTYP